MIIYENEIKYRGFRSKFWGMNISMLKKSSFPLKIGVCRGWNFSLCWNLLNDNGIFKKMFLLYIKPKHIDLWKLCKICIGPGFSWLFWAMIIQKVSLKQKIYNSTKILFWRVLINLFICKSSNYKYRSSKIAVYRVHM